MPAPAGDFGEARIFCRGCAIHAHPLAFAFRIGAIEGAVDVYPAHATRKGCATDLDAIAIHIDLFCRPR